MKKRYLVLSDGTVYEGQAFGADVCNIGELVFNTGVCGYMDVLTDPACYGQIVLQTFPLMGNCGIIPSGDAMPCYLKGYVVREWCETPSNFRAEDDLDIFLKERGVPGLCGVDTREITRHIRENGVMNAILCDEPTADLAAIAAYTVKDAVATTGGKETVVYPSEGEQKYRVALWNLGSCKALVQALQARGCEVTAYPADAKAETLLASNPDGVVIASGAGNPAENTAIAEEIKKVFGKLPLFGVGLGHQLLAMSQGATIEKLKYGHHGGNQPVRDNVTGRTYVTAQNHGYVVATDSVPADAVRFVNVNDRSCEGLWYPQQKALSVQFHPETTAGPLETAFLLDDVCAMMGGDR